MKIIKNTEIFKSAKWVILKDFYEDGGELFEYVFSEEKKDDISFYINIAREVGGDILEIACGSGRILIPMAKKGINVVGFDNSMTMLRLADKKITQNRLKKKIQIFLADMTDFALKKKFNMAFVAYNTFNHIISHEKQINTLMAVNNSLISGGTFVMEVIPYRKINFTGIVYRRTKYNKNLNLKIEAYSSTNYDHKKDIEIVTWFYLIKKEKKIENMFRSTFLRKLIKMNDIYSMLKKCGFTNINLYGNYNRDENAEEKKIFIARKK